MFISSTCATIHTVLCCFHCPASCHNSMASTCLLQSVSRYISIASIRRCSCSYQPLTYVNIIEEMDAPFAPSVAIYSTNWPRIPESTATIIRLRSTVMIPIYRNDSNNPSAPDFLSSGCYCKISVFPQTIRRLNLASCSRLRMLTLMQKNAESITEVRNQKGRQQCSGI